MQRHPLFSTGDAAALSLLRMLHRLYQSATLLGKLLFLLAVGFSTYLMADTVLPYLLPPFPSDIDFLRVKQQILSIDHWRWSFYLHISSSVVVLAAGLSQFSRSLLRKAPRWHRLIGKSYIGLILFVAGPTGLVMAFYGEGGLSGQIAFVLQAIAWWSSTYLAYKAIRRGQVRAHAAWLLRSYALTLSAISLRGMMFLFSYLEAWPYSQLELNYTLVAWLSWTVNLFLAELLLLTPFLNRYFH